MAQMGLIGLKIVRFKDMDVTDLFPSALWFQNNSTKACTYRSIALPEVLN